MQLPIIKFNSNSWLYFAQSFEIWFRKPCILGQRTLHVVKTGSLPLDSLPTVSH